MVVFVRNSRMLRIVGISDISQVRVNASKNYIRSSDHLWVVAPIGRCVSDTTLDSILFEFGERFAGRLAIICTRIDETMRLSTFVQEYQDAAEEVEQIDKVYKTARESFSKAKALARSARKPSTIATRTREVEVCRQRYETGLNDRLHFMVRTRNDEVAKRLYQEKSEYLQDGKTGRIFFASNQHYMWLKGFKDSGSDAMGQLSAEMTGILDLRRYALSIPAQDMWSTFMAHIRHTSVAFMKSLTIWAARTSVDSGDELTSIKKKSSKASIKKRAV